jgi:hypothetical protein
VYSLRFGITLIALACGFASFIATKYFSPPTYEAGELVYRLFLASYGLVFPAYVWLCMIPNWRSPSPPTRRMLAIFAASVLIACPFYWLGFIENKTMWLLPGLALVLLARLAVPRGAVCS